MAGSKRNADKAMKSAAKSEPTEELPVALPSGSRGTPAPKHASKVVNLRRSIDREIEEGIRSETIRFWRALALCFLPLQKTKQRKIVREVRLGRDLWVQLSFSATEDGVDLPYGSDRMLLHGLLHLAMTQGERRITFDSMADLLRMMGADRSGHYYRRLREGLDRIAALHISVRASDLPGSSGERGVNFVVIDRWYLPKRGEKAVQEETAQMALPGMRGAPEPHHIVLSRALMDHLQSSAETQLLVRLDVVQLCTGKPKLFDLALFLFHRCGAARSESMVPHEVLIDLFGSENEDERRTIRKLRENLLLLQEATGRAPDGSYRLNAELVPMPAEPKKGPGRRKKRWGLLIRPSRQWPISSGTAAEARSRVLEWRADSAKSLR